MFFPLSKKIWHRDVPCREKLLFGGPEPGPAWVRPYTKRSPDGSQRGSLRSVSGSGLWCAGRHYCKESSEVAALGFWEPRPQVQTPPYPSAALEPWCTHLGQASSLTTSYWTYAGGTNQVPLPLLHLVRARPPAQCPLKRERRLDGQLTPGRVTPITECC